jgi:hypothetical protein
MLADMDAWGYTFRLGVGPRLVRARRQRCTCLAGPRGLVDSAGRPSFRIRFEQLPIRCV